MREEGLECRGHRHHYRGRVWRGERCGRKRWKEKGQHEGTRDTLAPL